MKIIKDIAQGSDEWLELRLGKVTGSKFSTVMSKGRGNAVSKTRQSYMYELAAERLTNEQTQTFSNEWMERGSRLENEARTLYEFTKDIDVEQVTFVEVNENCGVSPDGLIGVCSGLEIKCPKPSTHIEYLKTGKLPSIYVAQVQGCMWATSSSTWDFMSYCPGIKPLILTIQRDNEYIKTLESEIEKFTVELLGLVEGLKA